VEELVRFGAITPEQAREHPKRNVITRALGTEPGVDADYFECKLQRGDVLLLCSDGLSNTVQDWEMLKAARQHRDPEKLCHSLMELALTRGARDNVTVLTVIR